MNGVGACSVQSSAQRKSKTNYTDDRKKRAKRIARTSRLHHLQPSAAHIFFAKSCVNALLMSRLVRK